MIQPDINLKYLGSDDQVELVLKLEQSGKLSDARALLEKTLDEYCVDRNSKKINEILSRVENRKVYRKLFSVYKVRDDIITGRFDYKSIGNLRESYLDFDNEQKTLGHYQDLLLDTFKQFTSNLELVKNEIQLVSFIEKTITHDDKSRQLSEPRVLDFKNSWLIKQLVLFPRDAKVLNYSVLALIHSSEVHTAKQLYVYMVSNKVIISKRLKYWVEVKNWEKENLYKKTTPDDETQIFHNKISNLKIDELLGKSEKPFVGRGEYREILNSYQLSPLNKDDAARSEMEEQLIISYGDQGVTGRINFYLENEFYKEAYKLACEQIENAKQHEDLDINENLNWFYLSLFALLMKNDYNMAIEFTDKYEHHWKLLGVKAVDLWYLSAEAYFYSGYFEKAQQYYLQINKLSPDYQLTKVRLEEIKAHK